MLLFWIALFSSGILQLFGAVAGCIGSGDIKFLLPYSVYAIVNILVGFLGMRGIQ